MSELVASEELRMRQAGPVVPTVIDVRGADEYAAGHISGAMNIPADEWPRRLAEVPGDRPVVTY